MKNTLSKLSTKYRYTYILLRQLVITDFKVRYQGSFLGYIWSLLRPSAIFAILYIVFGRVLNVGDGIQNYAIYLLLGIVLWNFFVEITTGSVTAIVAKGDLMRKLSFPRYVIVVAGSISALINLIINLVVVGVLSAIKGVDFGLDILVLLPLILELYVFSLAIAFLLSSLYVKYRDVSYIWEVFMQAAFYATPIIYPLSKVAEESVLIAKLIALSPVTQVIQDSRYYLITDTTTTTAKLFGGRIYELIPIGISLVSFMVFANYFRRKSKTFAEEV